MVIKVSTARSFEPEVIRAFRFLVTEHALIGPSSPGPTQVCYVGPEVAYTITYDPAGHTVTTNVARDVGPVRLTAELPALVVSAALGHPATVPCTARTPLEMRAAILTQAHYVRRLQPYLTPLNVLPLMRAAHARSG
ncbi:hypothetical protein BJ973_001422 [Actinoplanes tereljensis]|uniref:Uncharacterized protein n=1 Tax=Paractinoplanes tereljensis TaxID=571912 RepID=A0A919TRU3_9ACTN|nr:hypothetical protein [Actinoplanes tereljensis]GIF20673.1 hypothetical protein Ate02nite_34030 [Actinoplanes tereljensis]